MFRKPIRLGILFLAALTLAAAMPRQASAQFSLRTPGFRLSVGNGGYYNNGYYSGYYNGGYNSGYYLQPAYNNYVTPATYVAPAVVYHDHAAYGSASYVAPGYIAPVINSGYYSNQGYYNGGYYGNRPYYGGRYWR